MSITRDFSIITVLVIDDDAQALSVVQAFLKQERYRLLFAQDGQQGLDKLHELLTTDTLPDVIICDIMMPNLDGISFCRKVKAEEYTRNIPILITSSLTDVESVVYALDAGADDYLVKPIRSTELRARVRTMIRLRLQYLQLEQSLAVKNDVLRMVANDFVKPMAKLEQNLDHLSATTDENPDSDLTLQQSQTIVNRLQVALDDLQALLAAGN